MIEIENVTTYRGPATVYFRQILRQLVDLGGLTEASGTILDFGCGHGELKALYPNLDIVGYDIVPELGDVDDWRQVEFDVVVVNAVFYTFTAGELLDLLDDFKAHRPEATFLIGMSSQSLLNRVGKAVLGFSDAHDGTQLDPEAELDVLTQRLRILDRRSVWGLSSLYKMEFL